MQSILQLCAHCFCFSPFHVGEAVQRFNRWNLSSSLRRDVRSSCCCVFVLSTCVNLEYRNFWNNFLWNVIISGCPANVNHNCNYSLRKGVVCNFWFQWFNAMIFCVSECAGPDCTGQWCFAQEQEECLGSAGWTPRYVTLSSPCEKVGASANPPPLTPQSFTPWEEGEGVSFSAKKKTRKSIKLYFLKCDSCVFVLLRPLLCQL